MRKPNWNNNTKIAALAVALVAIMTAAYCLTRLFLRPNVSLAAKRVDSIVSANLAAADIKPSQIQKNSVPKKDGGVNWEQIEVVVALDGSQSLPAVSKKLHSGLTRPVFAVKEVKTEKNNSIDEIQFSVYYDEFPVYQMLLTQKRIASIPKGIWREKRPKIALIVDDVGYDKKRALELLNMRRPMTIAIFPQLRHSKMIAQTAHSMGYEVMMHLPMEPDEKLRRNPGMIASDMSEQQLYSMMDSDFDSIPYVAGVNNHQGSKMTRNP
ncbi:MAG: divergent polysaccharide deacetylase family protein [Candidatus Lindowbacteria bacterium]|nr:divergent polysaccharide deacetylase family protein [Candidatus Lindowbacteria bacterium]